MLETAPLQQAALATFASLGLVVTGRASGAHARVLWGTAALPILVLALANPIAGLWAPAWPSYALASVIAFGLALGTALVAALTFAHGERDRLLVFATPLFAWANFTLFAGTVRAGIALVHRLA